MSFLFPSASVKSKDTSDVSVKQTDKEKELRRALLRNIMNSGRALGRGGKRAAMPEIRVVLPYRALVNTVAATPYTTVIGVTPSNATTEYTELADLYEEVIVDSVELKFAYDSSTAYTTINGDSLGIWAYDPATNSPLGTVANGVQHTQHFLHAVTPNTAGHVPNPVNNGGYYHCRFKVPKGDARSTSATSIFGHTWSSTGDINQTYGFLKPYLPPGGATGVLSFVLYVLIHCRFRSRT